MSKFYVVLNEDENEGVLFTDKKDAKYASTGTMSFGMFGISTIADSFRETYGEDTDQDLPMFEVEIKI